MYQTRDMHTERARALTVNFSSKSTHITEFEFGDTDSDELGYIR